MVAACTLPYPIHSALDLHFSLLHLGDLLYVELGADVATCVWSGFAQLVVGHLGLSSLVLHLALF